MSLVLFCHNENTIKNLSDSHRELVLDLANSIGVKAIFSPLEHKAELWKIMAKHRIMIPQEVFESLEPDDSIEFWTLDRKFMFAMGPILNLTSYSIEDLNSKPWEELFRRDEISNQKILEGLEQAFASGQPQYEVTGWHTVQEMEAQLLSFQVKIRLLSPFKSSNGYSGIIAVVKSKQLSLPDLNP